MKKKYIIIYICLFALLGCKQEEIMVFEGKDAMSIYVDQYEADSTSFSFAYYLQDVVKDTVWIKIRAQGSVRQEDRTVEMQTVEGTTAAEGTDFLLPAFTFKAGKTTDLYPVVLLRNESLKTQTKTLKIAIKENQYFEKGAPGEELAKTKSLRHYTIHFNDFLSKPTYWSSLESYVGVFSVVKFQFMFSVYGSDFDFGNLSTAERLNMRLRLRTELATYEAKNGPLYDENEIRVTF